MIPKNIILFFLLLLTSCSIFVTKDVVSIDSEPRGAKVYIMMDGKKRYLGTTPVLKKVTAKEQENIFFKVEDVTGVDDFLDQASPVEKKCRSLNGNDCRLLVMEKLPEFAPSAPKKVCKTFMVVPSKSHYRVVPRKIREYWVDKVFKKNKAKCDRLISSDDTEILLSFYEIDFIRAFEGMEQVPYDKIYKMAEEYDISHLVFLNYAKEGEEYTVTPKIIDLHRETEVLKNLAPSFSLHIDYTKTYGFFSDLTTAFRVFPNSAAVKMSVNSYFHYSGEDKSYWDEQTTRYDINSLSIRVKNNEYPQWDHTFNLIIAPVLDLSTWGNGSKIFVGDFSGEIGFFYHPPFGGVFKGFFDAGIAYISVGSSLDQYLKKSWAPTGEIGIEYYFLLFKRGLLGLGYDRTFIPKGVFTDGKTNLVGESAIYLQVGFFFPEMNRQLRKLLLP